MRHLALILLLSFPAWAGDMYSVAVTTSATNVTADATCTTCPYVLVTNRGTDTIYCSPESDVTTNTGVPIATDEKQPLRYAKPLYCITTSSQSGSGTSRTLVWVSE